jgi:hypothetical protein
MRRGWCDALRNLGSQLCQMLFNLRVNGQQLVKQSILLSTPDLLS